MVTLSASLLRFSHPFPAWLYTRSLHGLQLLTVQTLEKKCRKSIMPDKNVPCSETLRASSGGCTWVKAVLPGCWLQRQKGCSWSLTQLAAEKYEFGTAPGVCFIYFFFISTNSWDECFWWFSSCLHVWCASCSWLQMNLQVWISLWPYGHWSGVSSPPSQAVTVFLDKLHFQCFEKPAINTHGFF